MVQKIARPLNDGPRVYSYIRFSTPEQKLGFSLRRQIDRAKAFAAKKGFEFDDTLKDEGLSGYHGIHRKRGALGRFLEMVRTGQVPQGSVLVVEKISRLGREDVVTSLKTILSGLIENGVVLQTLDPEVTYDRASLNGPEFIGLWIAIQSANKESADKSYFGQQNWIRKRQLARDGSCKVTKRCPAWLRLAPDRMSFVPLPAAVKAVEMIFELAPTLGRSRLVKKLNAEAPWQPPGQKRKKSNGWRMSYVRKILENRAVLGEYQPHRLLNGRREPDGPPIVDYFPRIIPPDVFHAIQQRIHQNKGKGGRTGKTRNLFSNLAKCAYCGGSMVFVDKGQPPKGGRYLECDNGRRNHLCDKYRVRYDEVEEVVLQNCRGLRPDQILPDASENTRACQLLRARIVGAESEHSDNMGQVKNLVSQIGRTQSSEMRDHLEARSQELLHRNAVLEMQLVDDRSRLQLAERNATSLIGWQRDLASLRVLISTEDAIDARLRLKSHLRELIVKVEIFANGFPKRFDPSSEKKRHRLPLMHFSEVEFRRWQDEHRKLLPITDDFGEEAEALLSEYAPSETNPTEIRAFIESVMKRRMSKEGRFFRIHFKTGACFDLVPSGSLASGVQLMKGKGNGTLKFVRPPLDLLWSEHLVASRSSEIK